MKIWYCWFYIKYFRCNFNVLYLKNKISKKSLIYIGISIVLVILIGNFIVKYREKIYASNLDEYLQLHTKVLKLY